jgi:peptidoglycan/xylan/chitin deacetylase (PgdA/CDA1 family)
LKLALKVDVGTFDGMLLGVPRLVEMLQRAGAGATFLFSLGPDHTGRGLRRMLRNASRTRAAGLGLLEHYGLRTLLYGSLLPGPDIGARCRDAMRAVHAAGFECGIHGWDLASWQDRITAADEAWTRAQMQQACDRFQQVFGTEARVHGAAGWQINLHALRNTQRLQFSYSSDTRGAFPFLPTCNAELVACPQIPTTLPTLDELVGSDGITVDNVAECLLERTVADPPATGHVHTLRAEFEGRRLAPVFAKLLDGWKAQGHELVSLRDYCDGLEFAQLPRHEIVFGEIPGRNGRVALQGPAFLSPQAPIAEYHWTRDRAVIAQHVPPARPARAG